MFTLTSWQLCCQCFPSMLASRPWPGMHHWWSGGLQVLVYATRTVLQLQDTVLFPEEP